jgi:NAD(P)-dependent dehydrogenase (short-subunit alcohol dehydrogenase family)
MATILLTGAAGQLGCELVRALAPLGEVVGLDRTQLDLADASAIAATVRGAKPSLIVNAGAYTAVDLAEQEAGLAHAVNGVAPGAVDTDMLRKAAPHLRTRTTPADVAKVIAFLCDSAESGCMTGAMLTINSNL